MFGNFEHHVLAQSCAQVRKVDVVERLVMVEAEKMKDSLPVTGSTWRWRHWAQTCFIMAMRRVAARRSKISHPSS
jgi:hypothetical protein